MNSLTNMNNYYIPNTLDGINTIQSHVSENALLVDGSNTMEADLNVGGYNIKNLSGGIAIDEAVNVAQLNTKADLSYVNTQLSTKADTSYVNSQLVLKADLTYVNSQDALKVSKIGDTMIGPLNMLNNNVICSFTPISNNDLCNKLYVNQQDNLRALDAAVVHNTLIETIGGVKTFSSSPIVPTATTSTQSANLGNITTALIPYALDANVVHDTGAETITGIKTFSSSPIVPTATASTQSANLGNITTALVPYALDANVVHDTGDETVAGAKTFTSQMRVSSAIPQIIFDVPGGLTGSYLQVGPGGTATLHGATSLQLDASSGYNCNLNCGGVTKLQVNNGGVGIFSSVNMNTNKITNLANGTTTNDAVNYGQLVLKADTTYTDTQDNLRVLKSGDTMTGALSMNTTNKIINLANGYDNNDACNMLQLNSVDNLAVHKIGAETISGVKTYLTSPVVPTATLSTQAVNKGQIDTEFTSKERTRPQAPYCKAWRKILGVDTSINTMAIGWSVSAHSSPVANSSVWGLEHTLINDGVFVRTDMVLYKGDSVNGFYFGCKAPDDNGSVVKIFVYDFGDNLLVSTLPSTCANQSVVYCPLASVWTVPSTQTYRICIVYQSGGVNHILTCISTWVIFFNTLSGAYNNTYINQVNKSPPAFYDLVDVTLGRTPIIYAYRTI